MKRSRVRGSISVGERTCSLVGHSLASDAPSYEFVPADTMFDLIELHAVDTNAIAAMINDVMGIFLEVLDFM
jgi:hypothetical protein